MMKLHLTIFCAALALSGCGRDKGRENCASQTTASAVADQIQVALAADPWLKDKIEVALSDVRTTHIDEKVGLATCQAALGIRPPKDIAALLAMPAGVNWLSANSLEYQSTAQQLVSTVSFDAQRTDDNKSMVVSKLEGYGPSVDGLRFLALRQPLVVDGGAFLQKAEIDKLSKLLMDFRLKTGIPIYVITVNKLPDSSADGIAVYAKQRARDWRLQSALLIVMSKQDRRIRLESIGVVGERLSDERAQSLIDEMFTPRFKAGDFAGGLEAGLQSVMVELDR